MNQAPLAHIVDDDEAIRDALEWLFQTRGVACRSWSSAEAFLDALQPDWRGCIVLDIRMDGMSGLACFDVLRERECTLPVIFLTGHGDVPMAVSALKNGAFDFVEKPFNDNDLVDLVDKALEADARKQAQIATRDTVAQRLARLTTRESEVMELILAGKYNKVIADKLNISMRTVEVHRARVFEKMGVRSAVELAQALATSGLRESREDE
ncbi:MAG: response regulator transcription factor [Rhodocyclaceae bacterium]|nr:response regulator transcription factor [Rhodocyclaceae bacterium]